MGIEATSKDYWIAPNAINITLNALGDANRTQGSASPGTVISCYIDSIAPGGANGDGLQLDNGRNPKRWPLTIAPTFFTTDTIKYIYAAIPRSAEIGTLAVIVFPSKKLDIYGIDAEGVQVGSEDYFYIFLQGVISVPSGNPLERELTHEIEWGTLGTYADLVDLSKSDWYEYNSVTQLVTFLKDIIMGDNSSFKNINLNYKPLSSVADGTTPVDSDTAVVTPSYCLSKLSPDTAQGLITFLQGIAFGNGTTGIDGDGDAILRDVNGRDALFERLTAQEAHFFNLIIDEVKSVGGQLVITDANCTADLVVPVVGEENLLRVYFQAADGTRATVNQWCVNDQALHYEFDVESGETRNYWIRVARVSSEPVPRTIDGVEGVLCHWIDLDMTDKKAGSSVPQAGDDIAQLGNRTEAERQKAIIISAYNIPFIDSAPYMGQAQGIKAPLFASYQGIDSFEVMQSNRVNVIAGNGNLFRGRVTIEDGSTLADGRPVNDLGTEEGNLLRNTDFCGDYESETATADTQMDEDTPLWSDPLKHWEYANAEAADYGAAKSGRCVSLTSGHISQAVSMEGGAWYMLSLYASGSTLTVTADGREYAQSVSGVRTRIDIALQSTGSGGVRFDGTCIVSDIILTRGTLPVEWQRSVMDAPVSKKTDMANDYLRQAISEGSTSILGGLVLSSMMKVGMWRRNEHTGTYALEQETGGMSGVRNDGKSPFVWGGGNLQQAIDTIDKYVLDPSYEATDEEVEQMAQFVVTHGGRAILNDVILRGYIYALGGKFKGTVEALSGLFRNITTPNGSFSIDGNGTATISNLLVTNLGKIASAIFKGDYMYSQWGMAANTDVPDDNYGYFNPYNPDGSNAWRPNLYLNFNTGKARLVNADIIGNICMPPLHVTSENFNSLFSYSDRYDKYVYRMSEMPSRSLMLEYLPTDHDTVVCSQSLTSVYDWTHDGLNVTIINISGRDCYYEEIQNWETPTFKFSRLGDKTIAQFQLLARTLEPWGYHVFPTLLTLRDI